MRQLDQKWGQQNLFKITFMTGSGEVDFVEMAGVSGKEAEGKTGRGRGSESDQDAMCV